MNKRSGTVEIAGRAFVTLRELANRIGVSEKTVWRWQKKGLLPPAVKLGRLRLYPQDRLLAFFEGKE